MQTHEMMTTEIILLKIPDDHDSFGVTLRLHMTSTLVDPPSVTVAPPVTSSTIPSLSITNNHIVSTTATSSSTAATTTVTNLPSNESQPSTAADGSSHTTHIPSADEPPTVIHNSSTVESTSKPAATSSIQLDPSKTSNQLLVPTRTRRRRVFYTVLWVDNVKLHALKYAALEGFRERLLQENDIILSIDGTSVDGLTFLQAISLFKQCTQRTSDGQFIECRLSVARCKPPVEKVNPFPLKLYKPVAQNSNASNSDTLKRSPNDLRELFNLSTGLLMAFADPERRMFGSPVSINASVESIVSIAPQSYAVNSHADVVHMVDLWNRTCLNLDKTIRKNAQTHWTNQWLNESNQFILPSNFKYLTDAQRHTMRRRKQGLQVTRTRCRCMSHDHIYVNDEKCPLYSNLRNLFKDDKIIDASSADMEQISTLKHPSNERDIAIRSREMAKNLSRDLNTMEKACCDRLARTLTEKENADAEQQFIEQMEEVQRTKTNQSLSAPSLTAMVLSTVSELECLFGEKMSKLQIVKPLPKVEVLPDKSAISETEREENAPSYVDAENELGDEDDNDDVPLLALCKRQCEDRVGPSVNKKQKFDPTHSTSIHPWYLAKLIQYISTRWGHVYQEPSHEDYVW